MNQIKEVLGYIGKRIKILEELKSRGGHEEEFQGRIQEFKMLKEEINK